METKAFYEKSLKMKDTGNHRKKQKRSQNRSQNRAYRAGSSASAAKAHRRQVICIQIGLAVLGALLFILILYSCGRRSGQSGHLNVDASMPEIDVQLLDVNEYSRPGIESDPITGVVIHYTANPGSTAQENRDYFNGLQDGHDTSVSSHFVVGLDGEIIQCVPTWEIAYASNERNHDTVSIECCHPDETGEFTEETYASVVQLTAFLCRKYDLTADAVIRHYDVTGKDCPRYFVQNEDAWKNFREDVARALAKGGSDEAGKENGERKG